MAWSRAPRYNRSGLYCYDTTSHMAEKYSETWNTTGDAIFWVYLKCVFIPCDANCFASVMPNRITPFKLLLAKELFHIFEVFILCTVCICCHQVRLLLNQTKNDIVMTLPHILLLIILVHMTIYSLFVML